MADNKNATRIEIETNRRGQLSDEFQELSMREMEEVTGGRTGGSQGGYQDGTAGNQNGCPDAR